MSYNGHRNWNHWNVCLWINNDEGLYFMARDIRNSHRTIKDAANALLNILPAETPDGAPYSFSSVYEAIKEI